MSLPGTAVLALLVRHLEAEVVETLVAPTVADLQHEWLAAGDNAGRRWTAAARGYIALVRLLFRHGLIWRSRMRGILAVFVLGVVGAVALVGAFRMRLGGSDVGVFAVFLLMAVLAPLVIRRVEPGRSYGRLLLACAGVGMIAGTALFGWIAVEEAHTRLPWHGVLWRYLFLSVCVLLGSALASAAAWKPTPSGGSMFRSWVLAVLMGAMAYAFSEGLITLGVGFLRDWRAEWLTRQLAAVTLLAFFFAGVALLVYVPVLAALQRFLPRLRSKPALATASAVLFPVPVLARCVATGSFQITWDYWTRDPVSLLWISLPYVLAGAMLGWLLAEHLPRLERTAS